MIGWRPRSCSPRVASTRLRCLYPLDELRKNGYPVELFNTARSKEYGVVIYSKIYGQDTIREAQKLKDLGTKIVFDLCDNHFFNFGESVASRVASDIREMVNVSDRVVASTDTLSNVIRDQTGHPDIIVIGDAEEEPCRLRSIGSPLDGILGHISFLRLRRVFHQSRKARLVWFGIHGGPNAPYGMADLNRIADILGDTNSVLPLSLTVISNSYQKYKELIKPWPIETHYITWRPTDFFSTLALHDISVIPVADNPFTRCKSSNRVVTALRAGLAVIADSIPSYTAFRSCIKLDDWTDGLALYISDECARAKDVEKGIRIINCAYSTAVISQLWGRALDEMQDA